MRPQSTVRSRRRQGRGSLTKVLAAAVVGAAVFAGCLNNGVATPMTPEQSKAQVVDAATEIVSTLGLHVVDAYFWHSSCDDQGDPPFRGRIRIDYPPAPSFEESGAEITRMARRLQDRGWSPASDFHSHGTVLQKNNVVAVLGPQNASTPNRDIQIYGQCRDITTDKGDNRTEKVTFF